MRVQNIISSPFKMFVLTFSRDVFESIWMLVSFSEIPFKIYRRKPLFGLSANPLLGKRNSTRFIPPCFHLSSLYIPKTSSNAKKKSLCAISSAHYIKWNTTIPNWWILSDIHRKKTQWSTALKKRLIKNLKNHINRKVYILHTGNTGSFE